MNTDNAPFQIGDRVVCINDKFPSNGLSNPPIKEGDVFTVIGITMFHCLWVIDVGIKSNLTRKLCICGMVCEKPEGFGFLIGANRFAKIDEQYSDLTNEIAESFKEVMEKPDKVLIPEIVNN